MGFEPTRAEPIGLAVQRLNHSATSSCWCFESSIPTKAQIKQGKSQNKFPTPGVEPGPPGWKPDILAVRPRGTAVSSFQKTSHVLQQMCSFLKGKFTYDMKIYQHIVSSIV